jgi:hypothetical protein
MNSVVLFICLVLHGDDDVIRGVPIWSLDLSGIKTLV